MVVKNKLEKIKYLYLLEVTEVYSKKTKVNRYWGVVFTSVSTNNREISARIESQEKLCSALEVVWAYTLTNIYNIYESMSVCSLLHDVETWRP